MGTVDLRCLALGQEFYAEKGYQYQDFPWIVSEEAYRATAPQESSSLQLQVEGPHKTEEDVRNLAGYMVASGEQSFLHMKLAGLDYKGKYQIFTPCYRAEGKYSYIRKPTFFKLELINFDSENYEELLEDALNFFEKSLCMKVKTERTNIGIDIVSSGIELGSYGTRTYKGITWSYGTGVAEPRTSLVRSMGRVIQLVEENR